MNSRILWSQRAYKACLLIFCALGCIFLNACTTGKSTDAVTETDIVDAFINMMEGASIERIEQGDSALSEEQQLALVENAQAITEGLQYSVENSATDTESFLDFDWTDDKVLMEHAIQPNDSARGWEFALADVDFDGKQELLITFTANHCGGNSLYIYGQDKGKVVSKADTYATWQEDVVVMDYYRSKYPYFDIGLLDAYVNKDGAYRYLSLDYESYGGGLETLKLYATTMTEDPVEVVRIDYAYPYQVDYIEMSFMGTAVNEPETLRGMLEEYMEGFQKVEIEYKKLEAYFPRDIVGMEEDEKRQYSDTLREALETAYDQMLNPAEQSEGAMGETKQSESEGAVETMKQSEAEEAAGEMKQSEAAAAEAERNKEKYGDIVQVIYEQNREDISDFFEYYPDAWQRWIEFSTFDFTRDGQMEIICSYVYVQTSTTLHYNYVYDTQGNKLFEFVSATLSDISIHQEDDDLRYYLRSHFWFGANCAVDIYEEVSKTESWDVEIKYVEWDTRDGKGIDENQQQGYNIYSDLSQEEKDLFMKKNYWEGMLQVFKNKEPSGTAEQVRQYSEIYKSLSENTFEEIAYILYLEDGVIWEVR